MTNHTNLIERLKQLRVILKSGDYDGADLMRAWCAMMDAVDALEADSARISTLTTEVEVMKIQRDDMAAQILRLMEQRGHPPHPTPRR